MQPALLASSSFAASPSAEPGASELGSTAGLQSDKEAYFFFYVGCGPWSDGHDRDRDERDTDDGGDG